MIVILSHIESYVFKALQCFAPTALRKFEADRMVDYSVTPSCAATKPVRLGFHGLTTPRHRGKPELSKEENPVCGSQPNYTGLHKSISINLNQSQSISINLNQSQQALLD